MNCCIQEIVDKTEKETIARDILNGLSEWFGMPDSTEEYIQDSQDKPFIAGFIDGRGLSQRRSAYQSGTQHHGQQRF